MAEPIDLVYIGDKPVKKDTVTLSDLIFPRFEPVPTPADIALRLLRFPAVWRKASDLPSVKAEYEAAQKAAEEEAARLAEEEAERLAAENMIVEPYGDIGKLTSAKARTLVEAEGLDIEQGAQEPIGEFRVRVRDALKAKIAAGDDEQ